MNVGEVIGGLDTFKKALLEDDPDWLTDRIDNAKAFLIQQGLCITDMHEENRILRKVLQSCAESLAFDGKPYTLEKYKPGIQKELDNATAALRGDPLPYPELIEE